MSRRPAAVSLTAALDASPVWRDAPHPAFPATPEPLATRAPNPEPWPLNELDLDLPDEAPPPAPTWADEPLYLGSVTATERGVVGPISLDVLLTTDGCHLELGPFHLDRDALRRLLRLCQVLQALLGHDRPTPRPEAGRGIAGWDWSAPARSVAAVQVGLLSEGETRP